MVHILINIYHLPSLIVFIFFLFPFYPNRELSGNFHAVKQEDKQRKRENERKERKNVMNKLREVKKGSNTGNELKEQIGGRNIN